MNAPSPGLEAPFLSSAPRQLLIGGRWEDAADGDTIECINPATGSRIAAFARGRAADVDRAVAAARTAFEGSWSRTSPHDRQRLMLRVHDLIMDRFDELATIETLDMGAPRWRTRMQRDFISRLILFFSSRTGCGTAETLDTSLPGEMMAMKLKAPVGVVGGIIPWNAPLASQWWFLGPVLATGCTAVLKPAEDAGLSILRTAELLAEAGVPDGVVNIVTGYGTEAGAALAEHADVDRLGFTGSVETARHVIRASAGNIKRLQLELGGKSPDIVFADADLDKAVPGAAMGVFSNSGQVCVAGTRVFVQRGISEEFAARVAAFSRTLRVGNGLDPDVQLGPLISRRQLDRVLGYVAAGQAEGAVLAAGGTRLEGDLAGGFFVAPAVFSGVGNGMRIAREEIFGPVLSIIPFDGMEDALRMANATDYGLAGAVWTRDFATAHRMAKGIRAGTVWINAYGPLDPAVGFGGTKMSGYGWKGGQEHIDGFLYEKAVYMNLA